MRSIFLGLAFILELVAFVSFAAICYLFPISTALKIIIFIILFVLLIAFWSLYMSPRAPKKFSAKAYYPFKAAIYSVSAIALIGTYGKVPGILFIFLSLVDELFLFKHNLYQFPHERKNK